MGKLPHEAADQRVRRRACRLFGPSRMVRRRTSSAESPLRARGEGAIHLAGRQAADLERRQVRHAILVR